MEEYEELKKSAVIKVDESSSKTQRNKCRAAISPGEIGSR